MFLDFVKKITIKQKKESFSANVNIRNIHHIGKRESQQDSFGISNIKNEQLCKEKGILAMVCDGMGGMAGGAEISTLAVKSMLSFFASENGKGLDSKNLLLTMLSNTNSDVLNYIVPNSINGGTTIVAAIIKKHRLDFVSVGDSRICLLRNGSLIQLNREHNYERDLNKEVARGSISPSVAFFNAQKHCLTSYVGMSELEHVDSNTSPIYLLSGDKILLMSDGVFGTLTDREISRECNTTIDKAAQNLEEAILAVDKNKQDNFTAVIIEII